MTEDEIRAGVRTLTLAGEVNPVFCGTAFKNKGVQPLLDAVVAYLPSPVDLPPIEGHLPGDEESEVLRKPSSDEPFAALAVCGAFGWAMLRIGERVYQRAVFQGGRSLSWRQAMRLED